MLITYRYLLLPWLLSLLLPFNDIFLSYCHTILSSSATRRLLVGLVHDTDVHVEDHVREEHDEGVEEDVPNQWNRNPRTQLEPQVTSLEKHKLN